MLNFLFGPKNDAPETKEDILNKLRIQKVPMLAQTILRKHPELINEALNDASILSAVGGPQGVRTMAMLNLEACDAIIASEAYQHFDETIRHQIQNSRKALANQKFYQNACNARNKRQRQ